MPKIKFLIDENVRVELSRFCKSHGVDFEFGQKGSTDKEIARLPQNDPQILVASFSQLFLKQKGLAGKLIVLKPNKTEEYHLGQNLEDVF